MKSDQSIATGHGNLPYADVASDMLNVIYESLGLIYKARFNNVPEEKLLRDLVECSHQFLGKAAWAKKLVRNNPHLTKGIRNLDNKLHIPRISRICLEAVDHLGSFGDTEEIRVPSPLYILVQILTIPNRPESAGYGFALARSILFSHYRMHPPRTELPEGWTKLMPGDARDIIESFRTYVLHRDNLPHSGDKPQRHFLAQFLCMQGILALRFGTIKKKKLDHTNAQDTCLRYLKEKEFLQGYSSNGGEFEFRLVPGLKDIPETQQILNGLMGVPIQLPGAQTVFFGGLQRNHSESLVVSLSGAPGTGKTSFALALSACLAPFGTKCLYCTFEEDGETLARRASGIIPDYMRRTTLANSLVEDWLFAVDLNPDIVGGVEGFTENYIDVIEKKLQQTLQSQHESNGVIPGIAPLVVVIDSLTVLDLKSDDRRVDHFCRFVGKIRALNCIALLLSSEDIPVDSRLEFLVDMVISIKHKGLDSVEGKPVRIFQLSKTRLQMSRPGAHILHLSGERGVRLSPQLPSQLDSKKVHRTPSPNKGRVLDTLRSDITKLLTSTSHKRRLTDVYERSKIFIQGHGSTGKAALALKILTSPVVSTKDETPVKLAKHKHLRILVVSFLYPQEHYLEIAKSLHRRRNIEAAGGYDDVVIEVMALTPSFIGPEDFVASVLERLDEGLLEGEPYTGVLMDGVHNTFLQFPMLQKSHMVWPALYSLLSPYELTIVTTFTIFTRLLPVGSEMKDQDFLLEGMMPFLHGIVQAAEFILTVEKLSGEDRRVFELRVESAFNQKVPNRMLKWDADHLQFSESLTIPERSQRRLSLE